MFGGNSGGVAGSAARSLAAQARHVSGGIGGGSGGATLTAEPSHAAARVCGSTGGAEGTEARRPEGARAEYPLRKVEARAQSTPLRRDTGTGAHRNTRSRDAGHLSWPAGATASPLYSVTVGGKALFVEKLTKFSPEMQVHYATGHCRDRHCHHRGDGQRELQRVHGEPRAGSSLPPRAGTRSPSTLAQLLILQFDSRNCCHPSRCGRNSPTGRRRQVKSLADYTVDNTGDLW